MFQISIILNLHMKLSLNQYPNFWFQCHTLLLRILYNQLVQWILKLQIEAFKPIINGECLLIGPNLPGTSTLNVSWNTYKKLFNIFNFYEMFQTILNIYLFANTSIKKVKLFNLFWSIQKSITLRNQKNITMKKDQCFLQTICHYELINKFCW